MKKLFLLTKTLLVMAMLCMGAGSAWGEDKEVTLNCSNSITIVGQSSYGENGSAYSDLFRLNSWAGQGGAGAIAFTLDEDWDANKVKSATLKIYPTSKCNKNRTGSIYIKSIDNYPNLSANESTAYRDGKHIVYKETSSSNKRYTFSGTTQATIAASAYTTGAPAQGAYYDIDLTTYIQSLSTKKAGDLVYFGIDISDWALDSQFGAYGNAKAPKLVITYANETLYTASFTETNSLSPNVTIYSDAGRTNTINNGYLLDGTTYYYKATLTGYHDYEGSFVVNGSDPDISFAMTARTIYNYTINAVSGGTTLTTLASGTAGDGEAYGAYVSKAILYNGQYYLLDDANLTDFYASYTMGDSGDEVKEINYTLDESVKAFWEEENMSYVGHSYFATRTDLRTASGGKAVTPYSGTSNGIKPNSTIGVGVYNIIIKPNYWDSSATTYTLQYSTDNENWNDLGTVSFAKDSNDEYTVNNVQILGNSYLRLMSPGGTPRHSIDYILVDKVGEVVGLIGLNGNWTTDILMTQSEGTVFTTTVNNFAAKAGINYEYKIRDYGTWDSFQFPAQGKGNKSFSVAEDGIYTLTFTADISTGAVTVESNKTGAYANAKVVTFVNTAGWNENSVHAWAWTDEVGSNAEKWPGVKIEKVGTYQGYDVFAYSYGTKYDKIIFNNGNSGDSNQTGNLTFTDGAIYNSNGILPNYYTVTYTNPCGWTKVYAYTWTTKGGSDKNADWPGVQMTQTENGYVYGVYAASAPTKIIFNNNDGSQTDDLKFYDGLTYSFGEKGNSTVPVTITDAGYATYASAATLNFTGSEITAYVATDEGNWVTFTKKTWVPAGTGILLKAEPGTYYIPTATSENEDHYVSSALVGVVKETTVEGAGIFVLMADPTVGFYKTTADAFTVGANTAYIPADVAQGRTFIEIDGNTTGISERVSDTTGEKCYYNLNGQRLTTPKKGLNIVNGQKFINK